MSNLKELIEIVRASRERTNGVFPLPDAIQRIIYDYLDAVDAGEMTLTGETLEILRKFGAKIGVGI